jgi:PIN domain nuclease of toxin-antitoxin system
MRLLLDTHALLWWWTGDKRLSAKVRRALADESHEIYVSSASAWEVALKQQLGKLDEVPEAAARFSELVHADGFLPLAITHRHALRAGGYALAHRDPFDRMLAAQSELEAVPLVTADPALAAFAGPRYW